MEAEKGEAGKKRGFNLSDFFPDSYHLRDLVGAILTTRGQWMFTLLKVWVSRRGDVPR